MTYHVQFLLLVRQPLFDRAVLPLTQTSWVLPPLSVGKMALRLYGALNYSHGLSKGPSFGTGRGTTRSFSSTLLRRWAGSDRVQNLHRGEHEFAGPQLPWLSARPYAVFFFADHSRITSSVRRETANPGRSKLRNQRRIEFLRSTGPDRWNWSSLNFPVKSPYGSPRSVKLLIPPTCLAGEARCEAPRLS